MTIVAAKSQVRSIARRTNGCWETAAICSRRDDRGARDRRAVRCDDGDPCGLDRPRRRLSEFDFGEEDVARIER